MKCRINYNVGKINPTPHNFSKKKKNPVLLPMVLLGPKLNNLTKKKLSEEGDIGIKLLLFVGLKTLMAYVISLFKHFSQKQIFRKIIKVYV